MRESRLMACALRGSAPMSPGLGVGEPHLVGETARGGEPRRLGERGGDERWRFGERRGDLLRFGERGDEPCCWGGCGDEPCAFGSFVSTAEAPVTRGKGGAASSERSALAPRPTPDRGSRRVAGCGGERLFPLGRSNIGSCGMLLFIGFARVCCLVARSPMGRSSRLDGSDAFISLSQLTYLTLAGREGSLTPDADSSPWKRAWRARNSGAEADSLSSRRLLDTSPSNSAALTRSSARYITDKLAVCVETLVRMVPTVAPIF
mmetsp:Transcript_7808/g.19272  ORF Transcript_7808/g.19272 Transcript_7808/m.19272 type:complete len:262 (+) Transcript_7808:1539-2324(+)